MEKPSVRRVLCIICPIGCEIIVRMKNNKILEIKGAQCPKGHDYAIEEMSSPKRIVISVVKCRGGELPVVSVRTDRPVPKDKIWDIMKLLSEIEVEAPVEMGQIIVENALGLGVNIIATRPCRRIS